MNIEEFEKILKNLGLEKTIIVIHDDYFDDPRLCYECGELTEIINSNGDEHSNCKCESDPFTDRMWIYQSDCQKVGYFILDNLPLIKVEYLKLSKIKPFGQVDNSVFLKEFHKYISKECLGGRTKWSFGSELDNIISLIENSHSSDSSNISDLDGFEYEEYCKNELIKNGWHTEITPKSGDYGADIIAKKEDIIAAIQCKNHNKPAGVEAVQQVVGSKAIYSANLLIVISPTGFTERATKLAKANSVLCIDHDQIYTIGTSNNDEQYKTTIGTTNNDQQYKTKTVEHKDWEKRNGMLVWEEYQERD